jgi:hypothetical protein
MQIQISKDGDVVRWLHTKNDLYSVKSAYNLARSDSFFICLRANEVGALPPQLQMKINNGR